MTLQNYNIAFSLQKQSFYHAKALILKQRMIMS